MILDDEPEHNSQIKKDDSYILDSFETYRQLDSQKIRRGLIRHIPLIALMTLAFTGAGAYLSYSLLKKVETQSILVYQQQNERSIDSVYKPSQLSMPSAVEMITLPSNLTAIKSILELDYPIQKLQRMISVEAPVKDSNLINITVTGKNPQEVIEIANTAAKVAVKRTYDMAQRHWQGVFQFFRKEGNTLNNEVENVNRQIAAYKRDHNFISLDPNSVGSIAGTITNAQQLQMADLDYKKMLVEYENLRREINRIPDYIERSAFSDSGYKDKISQLENSLLEARIKYAPNNPKIRALETQLDILKKTALSAEEESQVQLQEINPIKEKLNLDLIAMQAKLRAAQKFKEELETIVKKTESNALNLSEEQVTYKELLSKRERLEGDVKQNMMDQRKVEALLNLGSSELEIYQLADMVKTSEKAAIAPALPFLGLFIGLFFGTFLAIALEVADKRIRTQKQLRSLFALPCFTSIPFISKLTPHKVDEQTLFYTRRICERLQIDHPLLKSLSVTSSTEFEGKSLWSYQIAMYYKNIAKNVIILQLDHRQSPSFTQKEAPERLLEDYLRGEATVDEIITHGAVDNIRCGYDVLMKELMKTDQMRDLWEGLQQTYDLVIVDAPGMLDEDYAINAVSLADGCLYFINSSETSADYVRDCFQTLEIYGIKPLGVVLNKVSKIYFNDIQQQAAKKRRRRQKV